DGRASSLRSASRADLLRRPVADAVDRAVIVVRQQHRPVFQPLHVHRPAYIVVVDEEAGDERLDRLDGPVRVESRDDHVAADLLAPVPGAVAGNEDRVAVLRREHLSGVEAHAERGRMRPKLRHRLGELLAAMAPAELRIRLIAAGAIRKPEMLAYLGHAV